MADPTEINNIDVDGHSVHYVFDHAFGSYAIRQAPTPHRANIDDDGDCIHQQPMWGRCTYCQRMDPK